jgi:LmbE family N-acetylglucosaminyl deacetylase
MRIREDAKSLPFQRLAFGAHPDELEVAMGATTAELSDQG